MSESKKHRSRRQRPSALNRAGMSQRDMIIGAAACVVILVCGFVIARQFFSGGVKVDENPDIGFKCSVCGEEFILSAQAARSQTRDPEALAKYPDRTPDQAHCPKCGAKHSGRLMLQCPQCQKWFLLADQNVRTAKSATGNPVCPHCGLDLMEWKRKHP